MKNLIYILLVLFLYSCSHNYVSPPAPEVTDPTISNPSETFTVHIEALNYTAPQKAKLVEAEAIITRIFNSQKFKYEVINREYTNDLGLTSTEIYEKLMKGSEKLSPEDNGQMDLKVKMYNSPLSKVVGYTYPSDLVVYTNLKFHKNYSACKVASNLTHEWSHKLGFEHSSTSDFKSVPYSLNQIVEKLCLEL